MLNTDKKIKVIVFDDDILLGNMIVSFLKEEEMEAIFQSSLYGAVNAVLSFEPDIIVLDVEMGEDNGIEFASEIQSRGITIPILFVSSHVRGYEIAQGIEAGGKVYIKKPFDMEELIVYIRQYACFPGPSCLVPFGRLQIALKFIISLLTACFVGYFWASSLRYFLLFSIVVLLV